MRILDQSSLVSIVQSFSGLTAAVDSYQRLWLWQQEASPAGDKIPNQPQPLSYLTDKRITDVFVGGKCMFALGEIPAPTTEETSIQFLSPQLSNRRRRTKK